MSHLSIAFDPDDPEKVRRLVFEVAKNWYAGLKHGKPFELKDLDNRLKFQIHPALFMDNGGHVNDDGSQVFTVNLRERMTYKVPVGTDQLLEGGRYWQDVNGRYFEIIESEPIDHYITYLQVFWEANVAEHFSGYESHQNVPIVYLENSFIGTKVVIPEAARQAAVETAQVAMKVGSEVVKASAKGLYKLSKLALEKYRNR